MKYTRMNKGRQVPQETSRVYVDEALSALLMEETRKPQPPAKFIRVDAGTLLLDFHTINRMTTGTCIIPKNQHTDNAVVVCKEGKMIKVFKIIGES